MIYNASVCAKNAFFLKFLIFFIFVVVAYVVGGTLSCCRPCDSLTVGAEDCSCRMEGPESVEPVLVESGLTVAVLVESGWFGPMGPVWSDLAELVQPRAVCGSGA